MTGSIDMNINDYKKMILFSLISFAASSFSFMLIPFSDFRGTVLQKSTAYAVGILFWAGFIIGLIITVRLGRIRKKDSDKNYRLPGALCFFKNKNAVKSDIAMIISVILLIVFQKLLGTHHIVSVILLSVTIFAVYIHSILNGNNYAYITRKGVKK